MLTIRNICKGIFCGGMFFAMNMLMNHYHINPQNFSGLAYGLVATRFIWPYIITEYVFETLKKYL